MLSEPYRLWKNEAMATLADQRIGKLFRKTIQGPYRMDVEVDRPSRRRLDLSNRLKALEDALTQAGVIEDDHLAQRITLAWSNKPPGKGARIWITLESARAPD